MNKIRVLFPILILVLCCGGCSILELPFKAVGLATGIVGKVLGVASKLPKPPPGVIPGVF